MYASYALYALVVHVYIHVSYTHTETKGLTTGVPNNPDDVRWSKGDLTTITENPSPYAQQLSQRVHAPATTWQSTSAQMRSKQVVKTAAERRVQNAAQRVRRRIRHVAKPSPDADTSHHVRRDGRATGHGQSEWKGFFFSSSVSNHVNVWINVDV
jgi:hypothetical protein